MSLAAYEIGGVTTGGQVLGGLLALKMLAYVFLAPVAQTLLAAVPHKRAMVSLDIGRMLLLLPMAAATQTWQIAALAFGFYALSAGFTPLFQSVIPNILPEKDSYTKALAWSRIAYTLEALLSPIIAAALLNLVSGRMLFYAAAAAFLGSVIALTLTWFPAQIDVKKNGSFLKRAGQGLRIYKNTPRLQGVFLLNFALSLVMAWVLVNSAVYAGGHLGDAEKNYPYLMMCYGVGAILGAIIVPKFVRKAGERTVMSAGAFGFATCGILFALYPVVSMPAALFAWMSFGLSSSFVMTPGALVVTRSVAPAGRTAVFAAQFSLSHAGWLIAYPLAGWLGSHLQLETALLILSGACVAVTSVALTRWPAKDPIEREHCHPDLAGDHPHLQQGSHAGHDSAHIHAFYIDDLHPTWNQGAA
jgi:MFS family permease